VKNLMAIAILLALVVLMGLSLTGSSGAWRDAAAGWGGWANWLLGVMLVVGGLVWWLDWRAKRKGRDG